jgi:hypothetical protein
MKNKNKKAKPALKFKGTLEEMRAFLAKELTKK